MPAAAILAPAAIGAVGSIAQGVIGSRASRDAANTLDAAARDAARRTGDVSDRAANDIMSAGEGAASGVEDVSGLTAARLRSAGADAASGFRLSADEANGLLRSIYGDSLDRLEPYRDAGGNAFRTLSDMAGPDGELSRRFTADDLEMDPGYQFRLQEGQRALERSAASRGLLGSGGTLKALARYAQGVASDEFGKAFDRARVQRNDRIGVLSGLGATGLRATEGGIDAGTRYADSAAGNIMAAGQYGGNMRYRGEGDAADILNRGAATAGNFRVGSTGAAAQTRLDGTRQINDVLTSGASARAAGRVGSASAWSNTVGSLASIGQRMFPGGAGRRRSSGGGIYGDDGNYLGE